MSLTNYAENALLRHVLNQATYTPAPTVYVALCTADPGEAATGASMNEVPNAGNYARTAITFAAASGGAIANSAQVNFPQSSADWGTVTHYAIVDSPTYGAGNVLAYAALASSRIVRPNNLLYFVAGEVTVTRSGAITDYLANALLNFMFRNGTFTPPAGLFIGLSTTAVTVTSTGASVAEPSGNGYARAAVAFTSVTNGAAENSGAVNLGPATGAWGTPVASFLADSITTGAGNVLFFSAIDVGNQQAVVATDTWQYAAGAIDVSFA